VDAGLVTFTNADGSTSQRWFVNIVSAGLGGKVDRFVAQATESLPPTAAYLWASARALATSDQARLTCAVTSRGQRTEQRVDAWAIAVCNGTTFGSGMRVAPMARVDDGQLEVIALSAPSKLALALLSRKLYTATHVGDGGVLHLSGQRVEIATPGRTPVLLDIDGEPLGQLPMTIDLAAGALRLRV
jgi:diacylglycerol kinase family enzyme